MTGNYQVIVKNSDGVLDIKPLGPNMELVQFAAQADTVIELRQVDEGIAPQQALFKRNGNDLEIWVDGAGAAEAPNLIVNAYYSLREPPVFIGFSENGNYYKFVPQSGLKSDLIADLDGDASAYQSLGYDEVFSTFPLWPLIVGSGLISAVIDGDANSPSPSQEEDNIVLPDPDGDGSTIQGDVDDNVLFSSAEDDTIEAGAGNDVIFAGQGADVVDAGAGDDVIYLVGDEFASVDGGSGVDTLVLGSNVDLDLGSPTLGTVKSIEKITFIDDDIMNTVTLTEQAVIDLTDEENALIITGNATDTVEMLGASAEGTATLDGVEYAEYTLGVTSIYIDEDVNVNV